MVQLRTPGPWWAQLVEEYRARIVGAVTGHVGAVRVRAMNLAVVGDELVVDVSTGDRDLELVRRLVSGALTEVLPEGTPVLVRVHPLGGGRGHLRAVE